MSTNKSFSTETSERYSRALFEVSQDSNDLDKVENDIKNFKLIYDKNSEVKNFIKDPSTTLDGFLAHEIYDYVPEAVSGEKDAVDEDGNIKPQGIDQSKLVPLIVASIQELLAKNDVLEEKVITLEDAG